jgi:hypothetical protein
MYDVLFWLNFLSSNYAVLMEASRARLLYTNPPPAVGKNTRSKSTAFEIRNVCSRETVLLDLEKSPCNIDRNIKQTITVTPTWGNQTSW